jgi:protocatechuate 3,4-dioxygenase alpha subunit
MSDETPLVVTPSQTAGPFLHVGLAMHPIARLAGIEPAPGTDGAADSHADAHTEASTSAAASARAHVNGGVAIAAPGERILLVVRITDGADQLVTDALVEVWQPAVAATGDANETAPAGFGRLPTGVDGSCEFETVRPRPAKTATTASNAPTAAGDAAPQAAAHINVCLFARGLLRHIYTRVYFADDPALATDPVLALVPADRRETLIAKPDASHPGRWIFDVRLQGAGETVFFEG